MVSLQNKKDGWPYRPDTRAEFVTGSILQLFSGATQKWRKVAPAKTTNV